MEGQLEDLDEDGPPVGRQASKYEFDENLDEADIGPVGPEQEDPRCKPYGSSSLPGYWTFGYGSNNLEQMMDRTQNPNLEYTMQKASLPNHVRIFAGKSQTWGGSVASVVPLEGSRVHGSAIFLTESEALNLDAYEISRKPRDCRRQCMDDVLAKLGDQQKKMMMMGGDEMFEIKKERNLVRCRQECEGSVLLDEDGRPKYDEEGKLCPHPR